MTRAALALSLLAMLSATAFTQDQDQRRDGDQGRGRSGQRGFGGFGGGFGGFGGFGNNLASLARIEAVQKEVEILPEQAAELQKYSESVRSQREGNRIDFRNLSDSEREKAFADFRARSQKEAEADNAKVAEILLPHQVDRLKEISVQLRGTGALTDPEVVSQLKITDEQKQKLETVARENNDARRQLFSGGNFEGVREKMEELRKEGEEKTLAVLTAEQKEGFEKLKGKPFQMPEGGFGGRRSGGDRGPQGNRPGSN